MKLFDFRPTSKWSEDHNHKEDAEVSPRNRQEGWNVVDRENNYNEPGFEEQYASQEVIDSSLPDGEIGELMEKYEREEWELRDLMKQCEDHLKTGKGAQPLKDRNEVRNLAVFYREYLAAKSDDGLPFNEEERKRASADDLKNLAAWKEELGILEFDLAAVEDEERNLETGKKEMGNIIYSTKESGQEAGKQSDFLRKRRQELQRKISTVEEKIINPGKPVAPKAAKPEDAWKDVPEYSAEELRVMEESVKWLKNRRLAQPGFATGEKLSEAQILESAQEYAAYQGWPKASFRAKEFKGRRQLINILRFHDKNADADKQIRYVQFSQDLPEGEYYFDANAEAFFVDRKNPNLAVAPLNLMVSTEKPDKFLEKKESNREKRKAG